MTPERRTLGTTNLQISTVGFGAWAVGGDWFHGWGPQDDDASIAAIRHAVELGVNWIDTAAIYGLGHSEEVVGRALRAIPLDDRPYVFTKGGLIPDRSRPFEEPVRDLRPTVIRQEVEASLARLGIDRIASINSTGRTSSALGSRIRGRRWAVSSTRARFATRASATSTLTCSPAPRPSATSTRSSPRSP